MAYTILDVRGLLMRSYYGSKDEMKTLASGEKVPRADSALAIFLERDLPNYLGDAPKDCIAVMDAGNTLRQGIYSGYKAKRLSAGKSKPQEVKDELDLYMGWAKRAMLHLGIKHVHVPGQEADDVVAMLCQRLEGPKMVYTVDQDLIQLCGDPDVTVIRGDEMFTSGDTFEDIPPYLIGLYKSIVGDSSDEYGGIRGLGPKAWHKLQDAYGLDGLVQLHEIIKTGDKKQLRGIAAAVPDDKAIAALLDQWDQWTLGYQLAILHPEICFTGDKVAKKVIRPRWEARVPDREIFLEVLNHAQCPDLLPQFDRFFPQQILLEAKDNQRLVQIMGEVSGPIAFDFESKDGLNHAPFQEAVSQGQYVDVLSQEITGVGFCYGANYENVYYVSFDHRDTGNFPMEWAEWLLQAIESQKTKIVQNAMFERTVAKEFLGMELTNLIDTAITQSYVDENEGSHLKGMSLEQLNYHQATYQEVTQGRPMNELTGGEVLSYGADDPLVTAHLYDLHKIIMQTEMTWDFYCKYEIRHVEDDSEYFIDGTKIDFSYYEKLREEDLSAIAESTNRIRKILDAHCITKAPEQWQADTLRLWEVRKEVIVEKLNDDGAGPDTETYQKKMRELWDKAARDAIYRPFTSSTETKVTEFVPTPKKLTPVLRQLLVGKGGDLEFDGPSITTDKLQDWLHDHDEVLKGLREENEKLDKFFALLVDAAPFLKDKKKRAGPEYEALKAFCQQTMEVSPEQSVTITDGTELNFGSQPQMQAFLYGILGLEVRARSKLTMGSYRDKKGLPGAAATGHKAVASAFVYDLEEDDWRRDVLLDYKTVISAQQNISLYYSKYPLWEHPIDGLIHPQIKNCGTVTRRPTGTAPNILQVSKKEGAKIRKGFVRRTDEHVWVMQDFAGQEIKLTASESGDPVMLDAFVGENRKDIHSLTTAGICDVILPREGMGSLLEGGKMPYEKFMALSKGEDEVAKRFQEFRSSYGKPTNFLITYVGGPSTLAKNILIPLHDAEGIMDKAFKLYARIQPWQREVAEFAREHGYVVTPYGNRRHVSRAVFSRDDSSRMRMERQAVNATIQGCLQAGSRVHTDNGLIPIEETVGREVTVWTGTDWAKATGLNRGECELAEIELESGLTVHCDTRHKLKGADLEWHEFDSLEEGDLVALPKTEGSFDPSEYEMGWPFLLGMWIGDGGMNEKVRPDNGKLDRYWYVIGGETKREVLEESLKFLSGAGVRCSLRERMQVSETGVEGLIYRLNCSNKAGLEILRANGFEEGKTAHTKRVPSIVWKWGQEEIRQFLYGYALSDGSRKHPIKWHTPNLGLLQEVRLLLSYVGLDSSVGVSNTGHVLGIREHNRQGGRLYPINRLAEDLDGMRIVSSVDDYQSQVERRVSRNLQVCSQGVAQRIYQKHLPEKKEVYRYDRIIEIRRLGVSEDTYTMSVGHPLHQFVADGVIHKNTAADILKIVQQGMHEHKLRERYHLTSMMPIYDEIAVCLPRKAVVEYALEMKELMEITPPGHPVPMEVDLSIGIESWGDKHELSECSEKAISEFFEKYDNPEQEDEAA